jgi:hypothetical protein
MEKASEHTKNLPGERTGKEWLESAAENIFNPMGTGATFTEITNDQAISKMFRCLLHEQSEDSELVSVFNYGFLRGMFINAFPKGELIMKNSMALGAPMTELIFKANADVIDKLERQRVKNTFQTSIKSEDE